jgi:hypothetical protein
MKNAQPIFDPATHYRIEVQGRVNVEWLQSFNSSAEFNGDEARQIEDITVIKMRTDQSGTVGLVAGCMGWVWRVGCDVAGRPAGRYRPDKSGS